MELMRVKQIKTITKPLKSTFWKLLWKRVLRALPLRALKIGDLYHGNIKEQHYEKFDQNRAYRCGNHGT